jgi:hypothetical protein
MFNNDNAAYAIMSPQTAATNGTAALTFDTKGFDAANIIAGMAAHTTSLAALATLKVTECDTTVASSFSAIVALTGGTVTSSTVGFVIPTAALMGIGEVVEFQVDLRARKRYLKLSMTPGDTTAKECFAVAQLSRAEQSKDGTLGSASTAKHVQNVDYTSRTAVAMVVKA